VTALAANAAAAMAAPVFFDALNGMIDFPFR
jgi:hypothetical protein